MTLEQTLEQIHESAKATGAAMVAAGAKASDAVADSMDHWTMRQHPPFPGRGDQPVCLQATHRSPVPWPCDQHLAACDRVDEREARRASHG